MADDITYLQLPPESALPVIMTEPCRMVVIASVGVSADWQAQVSDWIVRHGCRYMMAWGVECSSWDDAVDMANLDRFDFETIPDEAFVMTTWHDDEPLEEVFSFAKHAVSHPLFDLKRTIILDISQEDRSHRFLKAYAAA